MNDTVRTPMASARWVRSATPGPMPDGPPAQSNRMMWRSSCIPRFYTTTNIPLYSGRCRWQFSAASPAGNGSDDELEVGGRLRRELLVRRDLSVHVVEPHSQGDRRPLQPLQLERLMAAVTKAAAP